MKILLHTRFYPNVGGVETVARLLAYEWVAAGAEVTVVTDVGRGSAPEELFPFPVYHRPSVGTFLRLVWAHDLFVHFNLSLRALWPWLLARKPLVVVHHGHYYINRHRDRDWRERLKLWLSARFASNVAVSESVASATGLRCRRIPNPYDASVFRQAGQPDAAGLAFVGRLVSDKGADLLLRSLHALGRRGVYTRLTMIGDGPERAGLEALATELGLDGQVSFVGMKPAPEVSELLRAHSLLVVPSLWEEPFGIVALEGIACGCVVVGSNGGGLPEAIGPCGVVFARGSEPALTDTLEALLAQPGRLEACRASAPSHLAQHSPALVADAYLRFFKDILAIGLTWVTLP